MFKLMGKEINAISGTQTILIWTYGFTGQVAALQNSFHHGNLKSAVAQWYGQF